VRIGIVGTGRIVSRFISEVAYVNNISITALYNPRVDRALFFAERAGIDKSVVAKDWEEFISGIDAVYIATPHDTHEDYIRRALQAGKHVLCEKPMALDAENELSLFELAKSKGLILLEAVKTAYCPGFNGLLELIQKGVIGKVHDVETCFTKIGSSSGREMWGEAGGSFCELGSYTLLPVVKLLGMDSKESYIWTLDSVTGVDSYCKMVISYRDATATLKTGLGVKSEGELVIAGEKGYIRIPSPWWITKYIEVHHEDPNRIDTFEFPFEGSGLRYEIIAFVNRIEIINKVGIGEMREPVWDELHNADGLTANESIWMASLMEMFLDYRESQKNCADIPALNNNFETNAKAANIGVWAHRGLSMEYPENTLLAFSKAAQIDGISGIELDVQLTKDNELVVIHDETLDRTTTGHGRVCNHTLDELKGLNITPSNRSEICTDENGIEIRIPTLSEVFEALKYFCINNNLKINIELKNSVIPYEGMEQKTVDLVEEYGLHDSIVYSSFNHESMGLVKKLDPKAETALLGTDILNCIEDMDRFGADSVHPYNIGLGVNKETVDFLRDNNIPVRMWNSDEPLYGQSRKLKEPNLLKYKVFGVTDIITNVPDRYL